MYKTKETYDDYDIQRVEAAYDPVLANAGSVTALEWVEYFIPGIRTILRRNTICYVARIEFFRSLSGFRTPLYQGAVLFDDMGEPLVHVVNALLGYPCSGSALSQLILRALYVPDDIFEAIQQELMSNYVGKSYSVVVYLDIRHEWKWECLS